jgi:transcriptional regulator with XRE-family HTH domain
MLALSQDHDPLPGLGQKLTRMRLDCNWTRREMADRSGIPYSTLRRLESTGEGSMRDYLKALRALGRLDALADLLAPANAQPKEQLGHGIKRRSRATGSRARRTAKHYTATLREVDHARCIQIADFPQLQAVAWNRRTDGTCTEAEALDLYERNWRFVDQNALTSKEKALIDRLVETHGKGALLV